MPTQVIAGVNDQAILLQKYTEAMAAYHELALGNKLVEGRHSIELMRFSQPSLPQLAAYIAQLAGQLAAFGIMLPGRRIRARNIWH